MKSHYFSCFIWFFLLGLTPLCFGQEVRIRVINAKDGRPLQKQEISVVAVYEKGEKAPVKYEVLVKRETDANGEVQFRLPQPAPTHLLTQVRLSSEYWHCWCMAPVDTQDVIQKGIVVTDPRRRPKRFAARMKAEPGEILFLPRPFNFLYRILYPLEKE